MSRLKGQIALITGSSSGLGRATALAMAKEGADIVVNYIGRKEAADEVVTRVKAMGRRAMAYRADVSVEEQVRAMFSAAIEELGAIDVLVNNAGLQRDAKLVDMSLDDWNLVIDVNLTGQFLCAREALRHFMARDERLDVSRARGKIICMSSVHEAIPWAGHVNYAASKAGVMMMMKSIAQEVGPDNIRVNSIAPGAIRTTINTGAWETPEAYAALMELVPQRRIGEPADVGNVAVWLASDEADYVHGASIFVGGGMMLYPGFADGG